MIIGKKNQNDVIIQANPKEKINAHRPHMVTLHIVT